MLEIEDFAAVFFSDADYTEAIYTQIEDNKEFLGGKTFFERLLELLQINCELHHSRVSKH
jgi:hypothetical protein